MKKKMKKATKAKLLSILTIAMVLFCTILLYCVNYINKKQEEMLEKQFYYTVYVDAFGDTSSYLTNEVRSYAATGEKVHYENYWNEINIEQNREFYVEKLKELGLTEKELEMVESIATISDNLVPLEKEAMDAIAKGDTSKANEILYGMEYEAGITQIKSTIQKFNFSIQNRVAQSVNNLKRESELSFIFSYIAIAITLLVQIVIIKFVLTELITPIMKFRKKMLEFADGNLEGILDFTEDNTEIGETGLAISEFQQYQKEVIADIDYQLLNLAQGNFNIHSRCESSYKGNYSNILDSLRTIRHKLNDTLKDIRVANTLLTSIYDTVSCGILRFYRKDGIYELNSINHAGLTIFDCTEKEFFNQDWSSGIPSQVFSEDVKELKKVLDILKNSGDTKETNFRIRRMDGTILYLTGSVTMIADASEKDGKETIQQVIYDVTQRIKLEEQRRQGLLVEASTDYLTGLLTRRYAFQKINKCLEEDRGYGFLIIDADNFKFVNDTYGHSKGDEVLSSLANILRGTFRFTDICARIGGDEFIVFLTNETSGSSLEERIQHIISEFQKALKDLKIEGPIGISIGGVYGKGATTLEELYEYADKLLYYVKEHNKGTYKIEKIICEN